MGKLLIRTWPGLHALIGGGNWNNGVHCGSRAVNCNNYPWNVNTNIGVWCVCDLIGIADLGAYGLLAKIYQSIFLISQTVFPFRRSVRTK